MPKGDCIALHILPAPLYPFYFVYHQLDLTQQKCCHYGLDLSTWWQLDRVPLPRNFLQQPSHHGNSPKSPRFPNIIGWKGNLAFLTALNKESIDFEL